MKFKLSLSLMLTCAFCLQASAIPDDDDSPARSASVAFEDVQTETPEPANLNEATASNAELDAADLAEIAMLKDLHNKSILRSFENNSFTIDYSNFWYQRVKDSLNIAEGKYDLPNESERRSKVITFELCRFFTHYKIDNPEHDKILDLNLKKYLEQGLSKREMRKKALESAQYFADIIVNNPMPQKTTATETTNALTNETKK